MRASTVKGVRLAGVACAVPDVVVSWEDDAATFGVDEMRKIAQTTGILRRRIAPQGVCASDLCFAAAERLFEEMNIDRKSIDALFLVTQTPDYFLPASACSLHSRLGLDVNCAAFDLNLGCSGFTYGAWMASHLIQGGAISKALVLAGDTLSRPVHPLDRSARPIFGDAGSAAIFEASADAGATWFRYGSDGSGQNHLLTPAGGFRLPSCEATRVPETGEDGNTRSLDDIHMNGAEVFVFTLSRVPALLKATMADAGWTIADVDAVVLHQANEFMLKHVAKSAKIPLDKVPMCLADYGNTSSATVPLTIVSRMRERLAQGPARLVLAGWGVGLSWSSVALTVDGARIPPVVEVDCAKLLADLRSDGSHLPESIRKAIDRRQ